LKNKININQNQYIESLLERETSCESASMRSLRLLIKKLNDPISKRLNVGKMVKFDGFSNGEKKIRA